MNNLTLLIPAKEESESLPLVLNELKKYNCKKLVVLDKNDKVTIDSIKNYDCDILFQKNLGYGSALIEGINAIKTEYLCIFNADGSFNPIYLKTMLSECTNNNDFIFASRYSLNGKTEDDTFLTALGNRIFSMIGKVFFDLQIDDILFTFVMGKTKSYQMLQLKNHDFRFCVELPIKAKRKNMNYINHGSNERKRFMGYKKVNEFRDGFLILLELVNLFIIRKN